MDGTDPPVHLGRLGAQIKIRRHWVEPAEVETALEGLPGVRAAGKVDHAVLRGRANGPTPRRRPSRPR